MDTTNDLYQRITNTIIAAIEAGAGTWRMPWHAVDTAHGIPMNAASKKSYRGVNTLVLWVSAAQHDYPTGLWATYAQWQTLGAQVRKDEHATHVVFWKGVKAAHKDTEDGETPEDEGRRRGYIIARDYRVFNAAQVDGYTPPTIPTLPAWQRSEHAEAFFAALGVDIRHGGPLAGYSPHTDSIQMPPVGAFRDTLSYYSTLAHEVTHNADPRIMPRCSQVPRVARIIQLSQSA